MSKKKSIPNEVIAVLSLDALKKSVQNWMKRTIVSRVLKL